MTYIYLHGFASSPLSTKARYYAQRFAELGIPLAIPNLAPDFEKLTFSGQIDIVRSLMADDAVTLIGSSMGGYVSALVAAGDPRVKSVVLLAPAFGFSKRWAHSLGGARVEEWRTTGKIEVFHYGEGRPLPLGYQLVTDAALYPDYPAVHQPALILHGRNDTVVPLEHSEEFARRGSGRKLVIYDSGHELTDVLDRLWNETAGFLDLPVPGDPYQKS